MFRCTMQSKVIWICKKYVKSSGVFRYSFLFIHNPWSSKDSNWLHFKVTNWFKKCIPKRTKKMCINITKYVVLLFKLLSPSQVLNKKTRGSLSLYISISDCHDTHCTLWSTPFFWKIKNRNRQSFKFWIFPLNYTLL